MAWLFHSQGGAALLACAAVAAPASFAAEPSRGAMLYMRTDGDTRSCVNCHGPDPGQGRNNILLAADRPLYLGRALNTVGAMGYLSAQLSDADRSDLAAFLGSVAFLNAPGSALQAWPITLEFGQVPVGATSAVQAVRLRNHSATALPVVAPRTFGEGIAVQNDCPDRLPPGGSCDLRVRISPAASGPMRGAVQIASPGLSTPAYVAVYGRGAAAAVSALEWQPASDVMPLESTGDLPVTRTLTLANRGPMPVSLANTSILGPDAARFQVRGCATDQVLQAGTGCELSVTYTPNLLAVAQATLQVRGDQGNPASVLLAGTRPGPPPPPPLDAVVPVTDSAGGCSVGPPNARGRDPVLPALVLAAIALAWTRRRHRRG